MSDENRINIELDRGYCHDCGHRGYVLGPRGGSSINIECGNIHCLARFNIAQVPMSHHIVLAHRIPRRSEGGSDNWGYHAKFVEDRSETK